MKNSKKGITLVELIICCGIIVMIGGACTAVLMSGQTVFSRSSNSANAQLDADVIQTYMMNLLPSATNISQISKATAEEAANAAQTITVGSCLYFDEDTFVIRTNGKDVAVRAVADFNYEMLQAGSPDSISARTQFVYTATMTDGSSYSGGFILGNLKYDEFFMPTLRGSVREKPICFSLPE